MRCPFLLDEGDGYGDVSLETLGVAVEEVCADLAHITVADFCATESAVPVIAGKRWLTCTQRIMPPQQVGGMW